ncbi:uncharacterized protein VTP21DRAFT_10826 [Calcarisporiella thermophila]|uniref:uncharacterized protein n=1 Tax=Calcarisporiella thermophila TaxID=911321 RepID=UPI0037429CDC
MPPKTDTAYVLAATSDLQDIPPFMGATQNNANEWIEQLEFTARVQNWSDRLRIHALAQKLSHDAKDWFNDHPNETISSWGELKSGLAAISGGENFSYLEMAEKAREKSFQRLLEHAAAAGGNAVLGIRYDANETMEGMTEVLAYGTAVTRA